MTYLLTFNCYATHLPGDDRGWVDRSRGGHRGSYQGPRPELLNHARRIAEKPYQLNLLRLRIVLEAIRETCDFRCWNLLAVHVRSTHVHVVADGFSDPDRAISDLKPMQPGRSSATMPGRLTRSIGRVAGVRAGCLLWSL